MAPAERVDAVVVGARCAGAATAGALARAGRRVVALDRAAFPADTISTHLLWPPGVAELRAAGALERVRALGAPELREATASGAGHVVRASFPSVDGIDHAWCVRRPGLDAALVAAARESGAEVRERARVVAMLRDDDRLAGVVYVDAGGVTRTIRAPLVVGADGRRSTVARAVGAIDAHRERPSGRACFFAYWQDGRPGERHVAAQWREGTDLGTAFPCDDGLVLVLLQPPEAGAATFRRDLEGAYRAAIARMGGLAARLEGSVLVTKVRAATGITSYFRPSAGPGWALPGDAGHFKDPVTAQGIRDAVRYGRLLGEAAAPVLDDPVALDTALTAWARRRERECLEVYQWTDRLARGTAMDPLEVELYRRAAADPQLASEMLEVFCRGRRPTRLVGPVRAARLAAGAVARGPSGARAVVAAVRTEARTQWHDLAERRSADRAAA